MRRLSLSLLLICSMVVLHAQKKSYTSGLKAGLNLAKLEVSNQPNVKTDNRKNFHAGFFYNLPIGSMFSFQPEALYSGEGAKFKSNTTKTETVLNFLTIPAMFQLNTRSGFFIEVGPSLSVLVKGKETITTTAATSELDLKKQIKKTNIAAAGGIGFKMKNYGINARYYHGLTNMAKTVTRPETESRLIQVSLSWAFKQ